MSKRCRRRFLQIARSHFDSQIAEIAQHLQGKLPHVDRQAHRELSQKLTTSLVDGETVSFEDPGALADYTLRRLRPRCRALLEVLLADNCTVFLESFLKRLDIAWSEQRELQVASLGGGPGFDAIAVLASVAALKEAKERQPDADFFGSERLPEQSGVRCKVLDLSPAWATSLSAVSDVASEIWPGQRADLIELMAPCDLRDPNTEVVEVVRQADVVIAAYVLHENEAALLVEGLLGGVIPDIFRAAPVGVPLIFLDATHRLWPTLVETACISSHKDGSHALDALTLPFTVLIPEGIGSHIHAVILIKRETLQTLQTSLFEVFNSHQRANEIRLKRLNELQKGCVMVFLPRPVFLFGTPTEFQPIQNLYPHIFNPTCFILKVVICFESHKDLPLFPVMPCEIMLLPFEENTRKLRNLVKFPFTCQKHISAHRFFMSCVLLWKPFAAKSNRETLNV